jgi:O-antigen/teichoic acid export membrane protein/glycosyltransferase involved in cell wall biosynthesis
MSGIQGAEHEETKARGQATLPAKVMAIASGEGVARIANLLLAVFVAREFGVRAAGAWALAQGLALYLIQGTDFGLRHVGARLAAEQPNAIAGVVRFIQKRRIALALGMCAAGYLYGRFGPVPEDTRELVSLFALATFGYALSLDWLAWGTERFGLMSGWRAMVALVAAGLTAAGALGLHWGVLALPAGFAVAYLVADLWLWLGWARRLFRESQTASESITLALPGWKSTAFLGVAMLVNQAFSSIDTMMLGGLTDSRQTGLYSAAYKLLLLALALYYLVMQALYPGLAAIPAAERGLRRLRGALALSAAVGVAAASVLFLLKGRLIALLFGPAFAASATVAAPLLLAIPMDFVASVLLTVLVAWDHPRRVLAATGTAVASNVALNSILIPRFGAMGAAWATPLSYLPFLVVLYLQMLAIEPQPASARQPKRNANRQRDGRGVRFSLVLATLDRVEALERALESFAAQRFQSFEVIVVDQNADERLAPVIARCNGRLRLVHLRAAPGVSRARNLGIAEASGEIVAFPDDDCWYAEDSLERIDAWFREHSSYSLLAVCVKDDEGNETASRWPRRSRDLNRRNALRTCLTACMFVRRESLVATNGFDARMGPGSGTPFGSGEDSDLALKVLAEGARGWFEKSLWVGHPARDPSHASASRALGYGKGFGYLLRKHHYSPALWLFYLLRPFAGTIRAAALLRSGEARFYWNSLKGRIVGYVACRDLEEMAAEPADARATVNSPK